MKLEQARRFGLADAVMRFQRFRLVRYFGASVIALGADMGTFLLLLKTGVFAPLASALSYSFGIFVHWVVSSRAVFHDAVARRGYARVRQQMLFVLSALAGLALTTAIVGAGDYTDVDPRIAKLLAIVVSFMLTWGLRSRIVFYSGD